MQLLFDVSNVRGFNKILTDISKSNVEKIYAAIAYTQDSKLVDICVKNKIKLEWWGLLTHEISTNINIVEKALKSGLINFYPLLDYFHPKVLYFKNYGIYIGSANMTGKALRENVEAGIFIPSDEISFEDLEKIYSFFNKLKQKSVRFSLLDVEEFRKFQALHKKSIDMIQVNNDKIDKEFKDKFKSYGLLKPASEDFESTKTDRDNKKRIKFTKEWNSVYNQLDTIKTKLLEIEQPSWISPSADYAIITDQFLHAYYYSFALQGEYKDEGKSLEIVSKLFNQNKANYLEELEKAIRWWKYFVPMNDGEDIHINEWAPKVKKTLATLKERDLTNEEIEIVFLRNHAARNHARQIENEVFDLNEDVRLNIEKRTQMYSNWICNQKTKEGLNISDVLRYILFGDKDILVERVYNAINLDRYRLNRLGKSIIGELVGWGRPDVAYLRNNRVNKALRCLGFDVELF